MSNTSIKFTLLASATDGWNEVDSSVYSGNSPTSLTSLDLSSNVGAYSAVRLMIKNNEASDDSTVIFYPDSVTVTAPTAAANHGGAHMATIPAGGRGCVDTVTDGDGCVQWIDRDGARDVEITLIGYTEQANTAPVISDGSPTSSTASPSVNISFSTSDDDGNADEDTIDLEVTDSDGTYDAIIDGVFQTPDWDGTISANGDGGHDVTVSTHPDLASGSCSATAYVEDTEGESDTDTWSWTVVVDPVISDESPTTDSYLDETVSFSTSDLDGDAQSNTIDLEITDSDGTYDAIVNGSFQTPNWDGTISANANGGHDVTLSTHPNFAFGQTSATAYVEDSTGGSGTSTWTWNTISRDPSISSYSPTTDSYLDATVTFSTKDEDGDAQADTINFQITDVNGTYNVITNGSFVEDPHMWGGSITPNAIGGHDVTVDVHPDFAAGAMSATVLVEDSEGGSGTDTWTWDTVSRDPSVSEGSPTGSVYANVDISFAIKDEDGDAQEDSIDLVITDINGSYNAIIDGIFQTPDWDGSITPNGDGGHDVVVDTHPDMGVGPTSATVHVEDSEGGSTVDDWSWDTVPREPAVANWEPGDNKNPGFNPTFTAESPDANIVRETINVDFAAPDGIIHHAIEEGYFVTPTWDGDLDVYDDGDPVLDDDGVPVLDKEGDPTVHDGGSFTFDILTHPLFIPGDWTIHITFEDDEGNTFDSATETFGEDTGWTFTVSTVNERYVNRVRDTQSPDRFVTWTTEDPDTTGSSYPGPGVFGTDTSDHCICHVILDITQYINRCKDGTTGDIIFWVTESPDPDGESYPGPGSPEDMQKYCIEKIVYDEWDYWRQ